MKRNPNSYSLWFMPCKEQNIILENKIETLANQYGGPKFVPHITLLGGFVDDRAITILKNSKQIVLPTLGSFLSLSGLISTLQEVEPFNKEITIVLNRIEKKEVEKIIEFIRSDYSYPIFKVKSSKCFENLHYQNKSISQMMREEPLRKRSYKEVHAQIQELIQHLKGE